MNKSKFTKRALISSAISLILCMAMFMGSTYAWFTDTASANVNTITAGNLDVDLVDKNGATLSGKSLEWKTDDNRSQNAIYWEPGCTYELQDVFVKNNGNLSLKYKVYINGIKGDAKLLEVIEWTVLVGDVETDLSKFEGQLKPDEISAPIVLKGHMKEEAGNEYQNLTVDGISISVYATQDTAESDSYGNLYDELAAYAGTGFGRLNNGDSAVEIHIRNKDEAKVGSVVIPADAIKDPSQKLTANILNSEYKPNITVKAGSETKTYDINVQGLKDGNTVPVKVQLRILQDLDPATVKLYHFDNEIISTYNPNTGYVTFETEKFSPFTVEFDADSKYEPSVDPDGFPRAKVEEKPEHVNVDLPWESYGAWSPTQGLDSQLEAAYNFSCLESLEEAKKNAYANWYCDFYVALDKDLGANQIFLGGNYGSFGWVGFHNGDLTLAANTELPLLGSVTSNPWTYLDVVQNVGTFTCGVGDVENALSGATFKVILRLTNPENEKDYKDIATIEYTFE